MVATHYVWDTEFDCITKEINAAGAVTARYTQEPKIYGGLISQNRSGATSIYHYDAIGTTRALTDSSQSVTDTAVHTAFGEKSHRRGRLQTILSIAVHSVTVRSRPSPLRMQDSEISDLDLLAG